MKCNTKYAREKSLKLSKWRELSNLFEIRDFFETIFLEYFRKFTGRTIYTPSRGDCLLNWYKDTSNPWRTPIYESAPPCAIRVKAMASSQSKICYQSAIAQFLNQKMDFSITWSEFQNFFLIRSLKNVLTWTYIGWFRFKYRQNRSARMPGGALS